MWWGKKHIENDPLIREQARCEEKRRKLLSRKQAMDKVSSHVSLASEPKTECEDLDVRSAFLEVVRKISLFLGRRTAKSSRYEGWSIWSILVRKRLTLKEQRVARRKICLLLSVFLLVLWGVCYMFLKQNANF